MKQWLWMAAWATLGAAVGGTAGADDAPQVPGFVNNPAVESYIEHLVQDQGFSADDLHALFAQLSFKPNVLETLERPPTARPWYEFRKNTLTSDRVNNGVKFWQAHEGVLSLAASRYGVPASVLVAIIGMETHYGRNTGSFRAADAIATAAFAYPRRAEFFQNELTELLLLAREEVKDPLSFKGSYAGALGWPQFMPSSFRKYAVDFDGDGQRDIWQSPADAIGSVGHYLSEAGWQKDGPTMLRATVTGDQYQKLFADKFNLHYTLDELKAMGVVPATALPGETQAVLFPLETETGIEYWLGFKNFYAITRYNKSTLYASAVLELARRVSEAKQSAPALADAPAAAPAKSAQKAPPPAAKAKKSKPKK